MAETAIPGAVGAGDPKQVFGFLEEGQAFGRKVFHSALYEHLPRDPSVRVTVYTAEIAPGGTTGWHTHNGVSLFLIVAGELTVEFEDHEKTYTAGDVFYEPIGVIHRGRNRHPTETCVGVAFLATSPDRPDMTITKEPW